MPYFELLAVAVWTVVLARMGWLLSHPRAQRAHGCPSSRTGEEGRLPQGSRPTGLVIRPAAATRGR